MEIYLPIAEISVNILFLLAIGLFSGFFSGFLGVGGGFLTTPFLMLYGIDSAIAVASSLNQIVSSSTYATFRHSKVGNVDFKMGKLLILGGCFGVLFGSLIFTLLNNLGYFDFFIALFYPIFMILVSIFTFNQDSRRRKLEGEEEHVDSDHLKKGWATTYFPTSRVSTDWYLPIALSCLVGITVSLFGVGGGLIMVPIMVYILRMPQKIAIGTSVFQIIFVCSFATFLNCILFKKVDVVIAAVMFFTAVIGAHFGAHYNAKVSARTIRVIFTTLVILLSLKILTQLATTPESIYTISPAP